MFLQVLGKSKMKRAFCEPKNVSFGPPIAVASALAFGCTVEDSTGELRIQRSPENGGDLVFKSRGAL
jgi:hypothetical protein